MRTLIAARPSSCGRQHSRTLRRAHPETIELDWHAICCRPEGRTYREMLGLLRNVSVKFAFVDSFPKTLRRLQKCLVKSETQALAAADQFCCTWTLQAEGQDQMARQRRTAASVDADCHIMYIASDCYLHIFHSAVRSGLQLWDDLMSRLNVFPARIGKVRQVLEITCKSR